MNTLHPQPLEALPIYYSPRMVADSSGYSPSAAKPLQVVQSWKALGLRLEFHVPEPATLAERALAHDE
jgi:hypothetical protein